jgi:hypothetical protein
MATWKEQWLNNYKGIGDTAELEKSLKTLGYGSRTNISYLPWAVVERIFRLQEGDVHWIPSAEKSFVDVDEVQISSQTDHETGETTYRSIRSYFINIQATWQGREYTERYPLQDSNGRPLTNWTQNELNKSFQRGKVKAIAIVSGIGYKLFEDGDLQFEEEEVKTVKPTPKAVDKNAYVVEPAILKTKIDANPKDTFNRLELEQVIKREFLNGDAKAQQIKQFLVEKEVKKVSDLSDVNVKLLHDIVK